MESDWLHLCCFQHLLMEMEEKGVGTVGREVPDPILQSNAVLKGSVISALLCSLVEAHVCLSIWIKPWLTGKKNIENMFNSLLLQCVSVLSRSSFKLQQKIYKITEICINFRKAFCLNKFWTLLQLTSFWLSSQSLERMEIIFGSTSLVTEAANFFFCFITNITIALMVAY